MMLSLENRTTGEVEAQLDIAPTLVQARQYLSLDIMSVLPNQELVVDVQWDALVGGVQALLQGAQSRLAKRDEQLNVPVMQNVQKRLVGAFPAEELLRGAHISTTDDQGNAVYILDAEEAVAPQPLAPEQRQNEQEALAEVSTLLTFLQRGAAENALLRQTA